MIDTRELRGKKAELLAKIDFTKRKKQEIINSGKDLIDGRTSEQWIKYYDDFLFYYQKQIADCEKQIKKSKMGFLIGKTSSVLSILIIFVFFFFMGYTAYTFSGAMINKVSDIRITQESEPLIGELSSGVFLEGRDITDSTTQYPAIVGKPVKWKAEVGKEDVDAGTLFLPEDAENIIIRKGEEKKDITLDIEINKKSFLGVFNKRVEVELEELDEYEIKYETPAPESEVEIISDFKGRVLIKGPDDIHYENILSFTEIPETLRVGEERKLKLYEIKNGKRKEIEVYTYDSNENGLIDHIEWITPRLSEAVFEWSINVLNVQSYPTVGGSWKAEFETIGTADLRIRAVNETTWTNYSDLGYDLKFLEIRCGEDVLDYVWDDGGILIENYSCDEIGFEVSRVLTEGVHDLEFDFGGEKAYAHNFAAGIVLDSVSQTFSNGEVATWAHTIGNGKNRVLIVSSTSSSSSLSSDIISITYNGKVFSRADFVIESSNPIYGQSEILYLLEKDLPVVAGVYDIEIIYSEFKIYSSVSGISLENVKQENLVLGDTAINAGASCIGPCLFHGIRAQKGDWIVEVAGFVNPSSMVPFANPTLPGQVKRWEIGNIGEVLGVGSTKLTETTGWINTGWDIGVETSDSVTRVLAVFSPAYDVVEEVKNCFDGIISYWNFDEGKGNIAYDFFGNNNGVLENMNDLDWVIGQVDGALVFDGVDDFVRVGMVAGDELNFDSLKNYTWTGWFRTNDITKRQTIFDYQCNEGVSGISIVLNNSALKIYDCEVQGFIYNSGILNQDEWYNFAITYSDRGYDIFINGISQPGVIGNPKDSTGDIYIGGDSFGGNIFSGEIDEIAVSDRVLTSSQIHQLYQNSLGGYGGCDDKIPPEIKFEKPTFEDGVISNENNIFINVSSSDLNNISTFIDFDGSLLGWFTFGEGSKNLITNGRFDSDSDWIKDGGWTIDNGVASYDGIGDGVISQDFGTIIGHTYEITFSVDFNGTGQVSTILGGQSGIVIQSGDGDGDGDGIYTFQITATTTGVFSLKCADGDQTDIDNILIRDITDIADYMYNSEGVAIGDAVQIDSGYFGKGFSFDGDGDYIDFLGSSLIDNIEDQFSFSVWVKPEFDNTEISGKTIFDNERIIRMKYQASESDFRLILDSGIDILCDTQGLSWVAGEWHNFAGTYNGTTISLYWDSILDNTCAYSGDILSIPNTDFKIGDNWDGGSSWLGVIDDVMIFNRSLSNEEIRALYANTTEKYLDVVFGGLSNGDYNFKAYSQDKAGNVNSTELRIVTVDVIAPEISITYPVDKAAYISNITSINYTVISGDSCWYSNDSGVTNSSSVSAGTRFSVNLGTSNLTVYCNNSIGVVAQGDISFIVGDFDVVNEINKIMASDAEASDYFGSSVFMRGDYAIIGAFYGSTGGSQSGAAYIFKKNSTGQYEEVNKIQASDAEANDHFGSSISISGDHAIVGANGEDTGGTGAGAGYIFKLDVGTNAPEILDIEPPIDPILVEYTSVESETTSIDFSFIVWDVNGVSDLPEIGFGNIVSGGYFENIDNTPYHYNTQRNFNGNDCHTMFDFVDDGTYGHLGDTLRRYTCNLDMFYYDDPEPWDIYITSFQDINGLEASNLDYVEEDAFSPQENSGIDISEASLSFGAISPVMSEGVSSISDMVITNTGNANFNAVGGAYTIYFKGRDLTRQGGAEKILAENFIAHLDDVSPATCDNALDFITLLDYVDDDNDGIGFDSLILPNGDISQGDATKTVYYCMKSINSGLPVGDYSTTSSNNNPWEINIGPVVFSLSIIKFIKFNFEFVLILSVVAVRVRVKNGKKNRKKKEKDGNKKKLINEENLLEVFEGKLKEKYDIVMSELVGVVKDKKKLGINEGIGEESKRNVKVPLIIFRQGLSPAEVLSKYLRENLGMRFSEIGKLINRDEKTISTNYKNSVLKVKRELDIDRGMLVPALIFADRRLSVLESVVNYLKKKEFRNLEIAEMLGKDQRNISTLYLRVRKKLR